MSKASRWCHKAPIKSSFKASTITNKLVIKVYRTTQSITNSKRQRMRHSSNTTIRAVTWTIPTSIFSLSWKPKMLWILILNSKSQSRNIRKICRLQELTTSISNPNSNNKRQSNKSPRNHRIVSRTSMDLLMIPLIVRDPVATET